MKNPTSNPQRSQPPTRAIEIVVSGPDIKRRSTAPDEQVRSADGIGNSVRSVNDDLAGQYEPRRRVLSLSRS
jgi:hypothetical protein